MSKEKEKWYSKFAGPLAVVGTIAFVIGIFSTIAILSPEPVNEYEVVEGNVISVEPILSKDGSLNYFIVTFDDDTSYNIQTSDDVDFTVNSKIIIELKRSYYEDEETGNLWYLKQIVKAPDNLEQR